MLQKILPAAVPLTLAMLAGSVRAQDFVYTNNGVVPNSISGFAAAPNGVLTPVAGSPFATGGAGAVGGFFAFDRIDVVVGDVLYAANLLTPSISAFTINPATGALTPIPGSPFLAQGGGGNGISLEATPDGAFLIAGYDGTKTISVFAIAGNGALSPIAGSPFLSGLTDIAGIEIDPARRFLAVASGPGSNSVGMYSIAAGGHWHRYPARRLRLRHPGGFQRGWISTAPGCSPSWRKTITRTPPSMCSPCRPAGRWHRSRARPSPSPAA